MSLLATNPMTARITADLDWTCWRCGFESTSGKLNASGLCADCRLVTHVPAKKGARTRPLPSGILGLSQPCKAWLRDFDDLDHPIHPDGSLVAPGGRLCGHRDCVEPAHVIGPDDAES